LAIRMRAVSADDVVPVAMWIMPSLLREISGLTLTSRGTVFTHDDNTGRVSEIDPKTGILKKSFSLYGNQKEDFEAITIAGNDIYLMASDGKLFRFREGADGQQVSFQMFDTGLGKKCEFESLAYESDSTRLVMVCKRILDKQAPKDLVIYRMPLPLNLATFSILQVPIKQVIGSNKWKGFRPSDITIDPFTRNYVIIASHEKGLLVLTPDGDVVHSEPLPGDHRQPEGVAITSDSLLLISDEANVNPAAITLYKWRPQ
ncbi:MAG TPA: SdiA-regulated domain-containing protein, partial [Gemmatimonadaceae bacterium]|nr:SdiA-regulated domain-containing protein [Gemmatimonadaceae bacterium]